MGWGLEGGSGGIRNRDVRGSPFAFGKKVEAEKLAINTWENDISKI